MRTKKKKTKLKSAHMFNKILHKFKIATMKVPQNRQHKKFPFLCYKRNR